MHVTVSLLLRPLLTGFSHHLRPACPSLSPSEATPSPSPGPRVTKGSQRHMPLGNPEQTTPVSRKVVLLPSCLGHHAQVAEERDEEHSPLSSHFLVMLH